MKPLRTSTSCRRRCTKRTSVTQSSAPLDAARLRFSPGLPRERPEKPPRMEEPCQREESGTSQSDQHLRLLSRVTFLAKRAQVLPHKASAQQHGALRAARCCPGLIVSTAGQSAATCHSSPRTPAAHIQDILAGLGASRNLLRRGEQDRSFHSTTLGNKAGCGSRILASWEAETGRCPEFAPQGQPPPPK